jgi:hypothetical protein
VSEGAERLGDLLLRYMRNNIGDLHELIEGVIGDIEQAIVTANSDVLSKVVVAKILGEIAEDLKMLEDAALCDEYREATTDAMIDAVGALLKILSDLNAGRPLEEKERELRGLQLTLSLRALRRLPLCCGKKGGGGGQA